jgi:hypothetical protein
MKNNTSYQIEAHKENLVMMVERKKKMLAHLASGKSIDQLNLSGVEFVKPV